jgi:hypothetical protein
LQDLNAKLCASEGKDKKANNRKKKLKITEEPEGRKSKII